MRPQNCRDMVNGMSKNGKKIQSDNPFAELAKLQFPGRDEKKAQKATEKQKNQAKKSSADSFAYDEDMHLFLSSIGEVNALGADKKIYNTVSEHSYTMAELLQQPVKPHKTQKKAEEKPVCEAKKNPVPDRQEEADDGSADFFKAMQDVKSLDGKGRAVVPCIKENAVVPPPVSNPLQDFMDGKLEFALNATEDYVEGHILGIDLMTVGKLQARQYSPEAHIDLHGLNAEQAYHNLVAFFRNSYQRGLRTVLVVTGKGKNSVNGMPVLRTKVQEWFTKDPFRRVVIAFCTAKQEDGGTGALYVLIRKQKKNYGKVYWDLTPTDSDFFL